MLTISTPRFIWTFVVGALITSNINWGIAEFFLNDWAMPRFEGFMRSGEGAGSVANILRMTIGFMIPLFVTAFLQAALPKPEAWVPRAIVAASLMSFAAFYGTYTFISGWGNVNWWPLMVTATCDWVSILIGALLIGFLQQMGSAATRAATA